MMDYDPLPNQVHVTMSKDGRPTEVEVENNTIKAPAAEGTYYYSYGVWWMDENRENVSNGDAFYSFVIKVI
ncbi:hypothetical protein [Cohnella sp. AR92]|uniref:hypothetical protein n=1 Tax=Cohnella sp. AR92 TaxID=648716 RepID=UPI001EDF8DFC|nr:hypothetical protein [Cohnella sp. AR92]